jgi:MFS family permease
MNPPAGFRTRVGIVYLAGLLQGCAFVLIPALGGVLRSAPFDLSAASYGALFLPETAGAIASALVAGRFEQRMGAGGVLRLGVACNIAATLLLATSAAFAGSAGAFALLLAETALLGFGFGLTLSVINHFAAALFPQAEVTAVTVLNAVIGGATALSPLILQAFQTVGRWWLWPLVIGAAFVLLLALPRFDEQRAASTARSDGSTSRGHLLVMYASAVFIYAIVEGSFGSWISVYASEHHFASHQGAWALAAFWGTMTLFRLLLGVASARTLSPRTLYLISPITIAACFIAAAQVTTPAGLVIAFAAAGAACSIYYPFSMSFALDAFPAAQTRTAGVLVAALMAGEGIGSWLLGPLQQWFKLAHIYTASAVWALPLLLLAVGVSRRSNAGSLRVTTRA